MFGKRISLFKLLGFEVRIDLSWIIIAILITWSLSKGLFPYYYKDLSGEAYWVMGITGAIGLFLSIIFHELSHSLVARKFGMPMKGITLFIFGGVAEMSEEPSSAKGEFMMAIVGPVSSIIAGLVFYGLYKLGKLTGLPNAVNGVLSYVSWINYLLAAFNLMPAFPLDGGRVLRAILWGIKNNLRWATRVSSTVGTVFGILLIILGFLRVLQGDFIGGMWWFLIGMFLQTAARGSYQQLLTRKGLEGESVRRFMELNPVTVSPSFPISQLVEDYVYKHHFKMFPVVESGRLIGCITTKEIKQIPREEWAHKTVGEVAIRCSSENTIGPDEDAVRAISKMNQNGLSRLMVTEGSRLVGIIALKDMLKFLSLRVELEE
ncbi:MAG: site-2 protease family protein [Desulfobacteraceae bacterium]|jgi:Zn-dependent protease/predicted transcriptional regulator